MKNNAYFFSFLVVTAFASPPASASTLRGTTNAHNQKLTRDLLTQHDWTDQIERFKPMVVNVETKSEIVFEMEGQGSSQATGFIVDAERGIICTNQHVTGVSPSEVKISFFDGSFTEARTLYYDPTHDFGFYQITDLDDVMFDLQEVTLGSWLEGLELGDELLLIGNNEAEEYSMKFGRVVNKNVDKGDRHSSYIQSTFDRTGGSSGSPVWNTAGEVIAIHARGTDTSSFELPVEYFADALKKIQDGETIQRGDVGADLSLISVGEATRHFGLPDLAASRFPDTTQINRSSSPLAATPKVIQVESVVPTSTGENILRAADIINRVNGELIFDNLYRFDAILNSMVNKNVSLEVYRNSEPITIDIPVADLEPLKTLRFAQYAGATFHDITPALRRSLFLPMDGVYMSQADGGSSFSSIGSASKNGNYKIVIIEINGTNINNLQDFIDAVSTIEDGTHTYVVVRDFNMFNSAQRPRSLSINLKYDPLQVFNWNSTLLDWVKEDE